MIRTIVVDDQRLVRSGFRVLLDSEDDIQVIAEAADGSEAAALAERLEPDVVLMDIRMPHVDGLEATRRIVERCPDHVRILVVTTYERDEYVFEALRAGASGFVLKDTHPTDLLQAIRIVAAGDALLAPSITRRLIREFAKRPRTAPLHDQRLAVLTEREREITGLVAEGLSNHDIAHRLTISPATARTHVSRAITKLGVRDRAQLVVLAYQTGLAAIDGPHAG